MMFGIRCNRSIYDQFNSPEWQQRALLALAAPKWEWMPGMLVGYPRDSPVHWWVWKGDPLDERYLEGALPVLPESSTQGALWTLLQRLYGGPVYVFPFQKDQWRVCTVSRSEIYDWETAVVCTSAHPVDAMLAALNLVGRKAP